MNIKNLLDNPHGLLNRRVKKYGIKGCEHEQEGQDLEGREDGPF